MKINSVSPVRNVRIQIKNKDLYSSDPKVPTRMTMILGIARNNKDGFLVGEDVIILNCSDKIIQNLEDEKIPFSEESNNDTFRKEQ